jgi:hypothetical protein
MEFNEPIYRGIKQTVDSAEATRIDRLQSETATTEFEVVVNE